MHVQIRPGYVSDKPSCDVRVIIDVFRASTTSLAILEGEPHSLVITNNYEFLKRFADDGHLVVSEVFDLGLDNSPTLVKRRGDLGCKVALKTSNLTTALEQNHSTKTLIGCYNNFSAVFQKLKRENFRFIEIVPAGYMSHQQMNFEDMHCAKILKQSLEQGKVASINSLDLAKHIQEISDSKSSRPRPDHYIEDLEYAVKVDVSTVVPRVLSHSRGIFEIGI